jgi:hypothetical protein
VGGVRAMTLNLVRLPEVFRRRGIYGPAKDQLPERAMFLHPEAAASLARIEEMHPAGLVLSDVYRSAEASLAAVRAGRGAQAPGFSAHNYGLAVDLDVGRVLQRGLVAVDYQGLLDFMASHGWHCHRRDGRRGHEDWHFNFLGAGAAAHLARTSPSILRRGTWSRAAESRIVELYGAQLALSGVEVQAALKALGFYRGALDGALGPLSREAVAAFQRAWGVKEDGAGPRTQRTLAYVAARPVA